MEPKTRNEARKLVRQLRDEVKKVDPERANQLNARIDKLVQDWGLVEGAIPVDENGDPL